MERMRSWTQVVVELILNTSQRISEEKNREEKKKKKNKQKQKQKEGKMKNGYRLIVGYSVDGMGWNLTWEFEVVDTWQPYFQS